MGFHGSGWFSYLRSTGEKPKVTWDLLKRVLRYSRPYRWQITGMLVMILLNTGLTLLTPLILRAMIDQVIPQGRVEQLVLLALGLLLIPALGGLINVFQRRLNARIGEGVIYDLRVALFARLQHMSLRFFTNTKVGELMSRLNNDVVGAQNAISNTIVGILTNIIQALAVLAVMLGLEWRLTLISVAIMPLFILAARRMGAQLRQVARQAMDANAQMNAMMNETLNIGGALLVKLFGRASLEVGRFEGRAAQVRDIGVRRAVMGVTFFVIIGLLSAVGTALVYGLGGYLVIQGAFTVGTIVAFGAYLTSLYSALQGLANAPVEFATSVVSFERVFEVIDLQAEIEDRPGALALEQARGALAFEDVSFRYDSSDMQLLSQVQRFGKMENVTAALSGEAGHARPRADEAPPEPGDGKPVAGASPGDEDEPQARSQARMLALEGVSFQVAPGQLAALVGPSGAGKTTLTYLIPRLYDPTSGRICLDGHDLRDLALDSLSAQIGMVTQEAYLFHDTIRTNLIYARLEASQVELQAACQAANIHDFIMELPDGYDTVVGERGYRLSGGEKQRIALARVILKNPRILVLDEATSHLDSESEALIQEALKRVMAGRTSIVIAHRLSTVLAADLILVMDRGRIVERGAHQELLALDGVYAGLYRTQFSRERRQ
ncbi:MAG: ABC transporter ATP-binding protein [Anaerolineales bacterium]|nr:ABC transporter ATP-binding protein [Anaerolineales bacterium]